MTRAQRHLRAAVRQAVNRSHRKQWRYSGMRWAGRTLTLLGRTIRVNGEDVKFRALRYTEDTAHVEVRAIRNIQVARITFSIPAETFDAIAEHVGGIDP